MHAPAIEHDDQRSPQLPVQLPQEVADFFGRDVVVVKAEVASQPQCPRRQTQYAQHAPAIVPVPRLEHRRITARSPRAASERLQHQAGFIEKHQASFSFEPLFLVAAKSGDAIPQSPRHFVRGHARPASADSSPTCATACLRSRRDTRRRTTGESHCRHERTSKDPWRSPAYEDRPPIPAATFAALLPTSGPGARERASRPRLVGRHTRRCLASDTPRTRWNRQDGRLPLRTSFDEAIRPPAVALLRAVGPCHVVS